MTMDAEGDLGAMCYGGEELIESVSVSAGAIGVTSHRLLVLTPEASDARFQAIDRPNVGGIAAQTSGPTGFRDRSVTMGAAAIVLLAAGSVIDLGDVVQPVDAPSGMGLGGFLGLIDVLIAALGLVDEVLILLGLGALLAALGSLVWYLRGRDRVIEIEVAGAEPVRIPIGRGETDTADRLRTAVSASRRRGTAE